MMASSNEEKLQSKENTKVGKIEDSFHLNIPTDRGSKSNMPAAKSGSDSDIQAAESALESHILVAGCFGFDPNIWAAGRGFDLNIPGDRFIDLNTIPDDEGELTDQERTDMFCRDFIRIMFPSY